MLRHPSAIKRNRQNKVRKVRNQDFRSKMRTAVKNFLKVIQAGKKEDAVESLKTVSSIIARTATKGIIHKKNSSRKISRLAQKAAAL